MIELSGKYNTAKVFTDTADASTLQQIIQLTDQAFAAGSKIRVMPDAHAGMGCPVGTTMTIADKIVPNWVGVEIGCGMETVLLKDARIDPVQLDETIHRYIPAGFGIHKSSPHPFHHAADLTALRCVRHVDMVRAVHAVGTLGGGSHFIELDQDEEGCLYLVVHTGSLGLGKQVCEYYQNAANTLLNEKLHDTNTLVQTLNSQGKNSDEISAFLTDVYFRNKKKNKVLAYCEGALFDDYLHDMSIVQRYAALNRKAVVHELERRVNLTIRDQFSTVHNYVDPETMILRKGAVSAKKGERLLIAMNMRDGSFIGIGKGNADWNYSAPHGAGRAMSIKTAKERITRARYEKAMQGIYSSTVNKSTVEEAPFAYKPAEEIIAHIGDTVDIIKTLKPLYNFKAAE